MLRKRPFSKAFALRAPRDEAAVRRVFGPLVRTRLLELVPKGTHVEGLGGEVLAHRGQPLERAELKALVDLTRKTARLLAEASSDRGTTQTQDESVDNGL